MTTERIRIQVTQDGAKAVRRDIEGLGTGADKASAAFGALKGAVAAAIASKAVQETIRLADAYTDLTNKVRFATRSEQEMASVRSELFRVANQNRQSVETTADVYSKLRMSTQALGLSQNDVIELTDTLSKATVLSGASADSAANSLRQLGQGMAAGALRGDELNSVLENTPYIAQVIAESLGKDIGAIREMGAEGKITSKIIYDAFKGAREEIVEKFGARVPTVTESFTVMGNVVTKLVGEIDSATGASAGLADTLLRITTYLDEAIPDIVALATELANISELSNAFDSLFPEMDSNPMKALQFMTLMVSTLEDRLIGVLRALDKIWAAMSFGMEDMPSGSLLDDLGDIVTGQGDVTARVLSAIREQQNERRGFTTLNADPNDPGNTLDKKGKDTTKAAGVKGGKTFTEIMRELEREHELLLLVINARTELEGMDERKVSEGVFKAQEQSKEKLSEIQLDLVESQLRQNNALEIEKRLRDDINDRIDKELELELDAMKVEKEIQKGYEETLRGLIVERELMLLNNEEREIALGLTEAQAQAQGKLTREQIRTLEDEMRANQQIALRQEQGPTDFDGSVDLMGQEFLSEMRTFGQEMALVFGPGGVINQGIDRMVGGIGDAIGHAIVFGESWNDVAAAIKNIGKMILAEIIGSLIRIPIQMAINEAIASTLRTKATAETVAQSATVTAEMAPAAAATSLATAGTNSVPASAAIIGVAALAAGVLVGAALFEDGGYTGNGPRGGVAGLVHGQEYVLNADATKRYRGHLEAMNEGRWSPQAAGGGTKMHVSIINQAPGVEFETRQVDDSHIELIARRVAPQAVADDLGSPHSKVGRAISQTTTAKRTL